MLVIVYLVNTVLLLEALCSCIDSIALHSALIENNETDCLLSFLSQNIVFDQKVSDVTY